MANTVHTLTKLVSNTDYMPPFLDSAKNYDWDWQKIATLANTTKRQEEVFGMTSLPPAQERDAGEPGFYADISSLDTTTITMGTYTLGTVVEDELVQDNRHFRNFMGKLGKMCGRGHAYAVSQSVAQPFCRAFNSSYPVAHGTTELCGTHTLIDGSTTVSNKMSAANITYDNVWTAVNYFESTIVDQNANYVSEAPKFIIFNPYNWKAVLKVLESSGEPGTADNDINALRKRYNLIPIASRFITQKYWFIAGENFPEAFKFFWRMRNHKETERDIDRRGTKIMTVQRWGHGITDWKSIAGNTGV